MKIARVVGREIFDGTGMPALECHLYLDSGISVIASVPTGISKSSYEAYELRDNQKDRLQGKGLLQAKDIIQRVIEPVLKGQDPNVILIDQYLLGLDGTPNKATLGANTMLAVSIAVLKAQALVAGRELYELIAQLCGFDSVSLPFPLFNMINGGLHAGNGIPIQECMVAPLGATSFRSAMEQSAALWHILQEMMQERHVPRAVGPEGGLVVGFSNEYEALELLTRAIEKVQGQNIFCIALDVAASTLFDRSTQTYRLHDKSYTSEELIAWYETLIQRYPIYSLEDGLHEDDWQGWHELCKRLGGTVQIVGDDIFAMHKKRIEQGIMMQAANTVIIKPNQIGTVTETLEVIKLCKEHTIGTIVAHRSCETEDTFLADLALGANVGQIKAGGFTRSEHMAKYNRLLRIEDQLVTGL